MIRPDLPASAIAGKVNATLAQRAGVVVTAPPGAGKSTLLPLTILEGLQSGKILMLEPRRLAARQIAERMAWLLGEPVGQTVGYRIRFETRVSRATRIEVLTEGVLTRMLIDDPTLDGVSAVIFDEFHERSLASDTALALTREAFKSVRPDLKIIIMSATIDSAAICSALDLPLVECEGRMFPVETVFCGDCTPQDCASSVAHLVRQAHADKEGDILAFLPGEADIRRCAELLTSSSEQFALAGGDRTDCPRSNSDHDSGLRSGPGQSVGAGAGPTAVYPLYGMLPAAQQRRAIAPSGPGERKVVLATPIAETSITIEGVRIVIDSGFCRKLVFNPQNSLSSLETVRISRDMADQRRGRAGRVAPGTCYRLWSPATDQRMADCRVPEILEADLAPMTLDIAAWGEADPSRLDWLTPPPAPMLSSARSLLSILDAVDSDGRLTPHGRELASLPCHPRIARMLLSAASAAKSVHAVPAGLNSPGGLLSSEVREMQALACDIAAVLEEKDPLAGDDTSADISLRINALRRARSSRSLGRFNRIAAIAEQYRSLAGLPDRRSPFVSGASSDSVSEASSGFVSGAAPIDINSPVDPYSVGALVCQAYPERIARAVPDNGQQRGLSQNDRRGSVPGGVRFRLAGGDEALVERDDALASCEWIAVAGLNAGKGREGRIFLASPLSPDDFACFVKTRDLVCWDSRQGAVVSRRDSMVGGLVVASRPLDKPSADEVARIVCEAARKDGLSMFDFSDAAGNLQRRIAAVAQWHPELGLPDMSTDALLADATAWLPPFLGKASSIAELKKIDLETALWSMLSYDQQSAVDRIAPSGVTMPSGRRARLEYRVGAEAPILRVRLQECFGMMDTPRVDGGRVPVLMELLSPGFKPVQLTSDLRSFWTNTYPEVRKELRRRYPKHAWPEL